MRILKNIIIIIVLAALCVGVFVYALDQENGPAPETKSIIINEFMASNKSCLSDQEGNYSDWIEVYNPSEEPINLYGFGLSNEKESIKWIFPNVTVSPKGYLVVFASGKGVSSSGADYQHTSFKLNASKGGIFLSNSAGQIVDQAEYKEQKSNVSMGRDINDMKQWLAYENATPGFSNDDAGFAAYKDSRVTKVTGLLITEVMPDNKTIFADNNKSYNDYIEIYNSKDEAVNLEGFCLSDNTDNITKWRFPDVTIGPGAYLIVYASGEDEKSTDAENNILHSGFRISAYKETIVFADNLGLIIDQVTVSETPADYAYIRVPGEGSNYQDEWEQTAYPTPGYPNNDEGISQFEENYVAVLGAVVINEVLVSNSSYMQEDDGGYYDWIEIYNRSSEAVNLGGYSLSDDPGYPVKWRFPDITLNAGEYVTVMASGLADSEDVKKKYVHTNFKLSASGEALVLFDSNAAVLDRYRLINLQRNISMGRVHDKDALFYFEEPTPNAANLAPSNGIAAAPQPGVAAGSYDSAQQITLTSDTSDSKIYYTLDGTEPTSSSRLYTGPVTINNTGMIRAIAVKEGYLKSAVSSNTYFIGETHSLPLISIVTEPANLWDENTGIYAKGPNAEDVYPFIGANFFNEWEKPASFEVFDESGTQVFAQDVAIRMAGGYSRGREQKSFAVFARTEYGPGTMEYSFFDNRDYTEYESLLLRQGGQDQNIAKIKEITALSLAEGKFNVLSQVYEPYVLYLNGEYWGVYFLMEKRNKYFIAQYEDASNPNDINILKATSIVLQGTNTEYKRLLEYIETQDMSTKENFDYIAKWIDTDSFMDVMINQIYIGNSDYANMQFYQLPGEKWKQIYYDFCWTFQLEHPTLERRMDNKTTASTLFNGLLAYKPWRDAFIERFAWALEEVYNPERVIAAIDASADAVRDEMAAERAKFGGSVTNWEANVEGMRKFARERGEIIEDQLKNAFSLSSEQRKMLEDAIDYE